MKIRIFTLLTAIFLLSNVSWGQEVGEYRARKIETITKKIEKPKKPKVVREINPQREGFFVIPEVGVGVGISDSSRFSLCLHGTFGYEFNNHLAFGVGTGFNFINNEGGIPLYANLHGDITKKIYGITPYYSFDIGYIFFPDYWKYEGLLLSPELGIKTNKLYIGCKLSSIDPSIVCIYLKLGYKIPLNNIKN